MKWLVLAALLAAAPARAQSKRYPPVAPDKDLEEETRSDLWESALHPDRSPYKELVRDAQRLLDRGNPDDLKSAGEKLDAAVKLQPKRADAYLVRGRYYAKLKQWTECADDLGRAEDYTKTDDVSARSQARLELGQCQARAGRYAEAERSLVRAASAAQSQNGDLWRSLGEVRIALGKLDEAIDALTAAAEVGNDTTARWLLALAYDRARRPSDAQEAAQNAKKYDPYLNAVISPRQPLLGAGDTDYLYGLAHRYANAKPEHALLYFRRFVKTAPKSPWRRRAEEHVRELAKTKLPLREAIAPSGSAVPDGDKVHAAIAKQMSAMRTCMTKLTSSIMQVGITKVGPRSPDARDRPIYRTPPAGVEVKVLTHIGDTPTELDSLDAQRCIEKAANKVQLPAPKDKDTYYKVYFPVVGP